MAISMTTVAYHKICGPAENFHFSAAVMALVLM
jgi:hypothetical protein